MIPFSRAFSILIGLAVSANCIAQHAHPGLLLTAADVEAHFSNWRESSLFSNSIEMAESRIRSHFEVMPDVPVPRDAGGGYTHEQHKRNGIAIYEAGMLYQWTGENEYAENAKSLLLAYADLYPTLGPHPVERSNSRGRLFWQNLNESVWLVYAIQGYDAVYSALEDSERSTIEANLLRPLADFLSIESPGTFDRIHNHGTWAVAAVGMTGYVIGDGDYVNKALYGLGEDGSGGFMRQLDDLFSPDGYYTEGPYYQRYALMPFAVFAKSIQSNEPEREIFEYRDQILQKAIHTTVQLTYADKFFPLNDAIKDKGLDTVELDFAIPIAFGLTGDNSLASLLRDNSAPALNGDGLRLALARDRGQAVPYDFESLHLRDGSKGDQGALSVFRSGAGPDHAAVLFKATSQGMGHGHFDRLNWLFYDNGREVVTDYGAARFLNVVQKEGGHYLPENQSWAKQTVAHNTLVVDESSHFNGELRRAELSAPRDLYYLSNADLQLAAATETDAYPGVTFRRTLLQIENAHLEHPVVIDLLKIRSSSPHQYDLPMYYKGQIVDVSHALESATRQLSPLGEGNGYQHLWLKSKSELEEGDKGSVTWLLDNRFYTATFLAETDTQLLFTETGANDPDFNLRHETGLIFRVPAATDHTFLTVLEPHGEYNGAREFTLASGSQLQSIERYSDGDLDLLRIENNQGYVIQVALSHNDDATASHSMTSPHGDLEWTGYVKVFTP